MQIIVAKILIDQGFVITSLHGFFGVFEIPWILAQIITTIFFVTFVNAYNFIDGVDGLAITETLKNLLFFIVFFPSEDELFFLFQLLSSVIIPLYYFNFRKEKKFFLRRWITASRRDKYDYDITYTQSSNFSNYWINK